MEPKREDLDTILDSLSDDELVYVIERSYSSSDSAAYQTAGISKSSWFRKEESHREYLNELANKLRRNRALLVLRVLNDHAVEAAELLVAHLESKNERVAQRAANSILDRSVGTATQKVDVTSGGERVTPLVITRRDDSAT